MKKKLISVLLAGSVLTVACKESDLAATAPVVNKADAVASVNGVYIGKAFLDAIKKEVAQNPRSPKMTDEQLLERLIQSELLVQEAKKQKLQEKADFKTRLALMNNAILSQAAIQAFIDANPPTDEELRAEYDKQFGKVAGEEYKARHILLKTEKEAKAIIKQLDKGADFATLAKEKSTGPSASNGGDLGWFDAKRMVKPFSDAVVALANGQYTEEPVKTQFGWHVILREDSRTKTPPAFEDVKEHFVPMVRNKKISDYLKKLHDNAKVEILLAKEETKTKIKADEKADPKESESAKPVSTEKPAESKASEEAKPASKIDGADTAAKQETTEQKPASDNQPETTEQKTEKSPAQASDKPASAAK